MSETNPIFESPWDDPYQYLSDPFPIVRQAVKDLRDIVSPSLFSRGESIESCYIHPALDLNGDGLTHERWGSGLITTPNGRFAKFLFLIAPRSDYPQTCPSTHSTSTTLHPTQVISCQNPNPGMGSYAPNAVIIGAYVVYLISFDGTPLVRAETREGGIVLTDNLRGLRAYHPEPSNPDAGQYYPRLVYAEAPQCGSYRFNQPQVGIFSSPEVRGLEIYVAPEYPYTEPENPQQLPSSERLRRTEMILDPTLTPRLWRETIIPYPHPELEEQIRRERLGDPPRTIIFERHTAPAP